MKVVCTLFCLLVLMLFSRAEISEIRLEEAQFQLLKNTPAQDSTIRALLDHKTELGLAKLADSDVTQIIQLIHPDLLMDSRQQADLFSTCGTVSGRLLNGEWPALSFPAILRATNAPFAQTNLSAYFQFRLFEFYFSNGLGAYLQNAEYVDLLQPEAVYNLLKDIRSEDRLVREIRFVINNSGFELFPAQ